MKLGQTIKTFISTSGKEIILRYPALYDVQILLDYINELSQEDTYITMSGEQETLESETKWLTSVLDNIEKKDMVHIMALYNEELVGTAQIDRDLGGKKRTRHVGTLGLSVKKLYRNDGIGRQLIETAVKTAGEVLGLSEIILEVFEPNVKARSLYRSSGFVEYGRLPGGIKFKDAYVDKILMYKKL